MSLLTDGAKAQSAADVREMILASGQQATLSRCDPGEKLFGHEDETFVQIGTIPVELNRTPPVELPGDIDAVASVLPEADVRAQDRLELDGEAYRVQTVVEERLFGGITHKALRLVKVHDG
jgi:hypothetical protein